MFTLNPNYLFDCKLFIQYIFAPNEIMTDLKISCSHIKHLRQLNKENLSLIFQAHFKNKNLRVESINDVSDQVGSHFQSDISQLTVKLNEFENQIKLIIKEPLQSVIQKIMSKLVKQFMRETFWFMEAIPALKKENPEIENISAKCFHANSAYTDDYRASCVQRQGPLCTIIFAKPDRGLLVLEDLKDQNRPGGPLISLNKDEIADVKTVHLVMENLGKYHGIWIDWLKNQNPKEIAGLNKEALFESLAMIPVKESNNSKGREWKDHFRIFKALSQQMQTIGKSPEIIEALEKFRNNDNLAKWMNSVLPKGDGSESKLMTIVHGDCWTNNFFVNEERTKIAFIDFQALQPGPVGRDIWYYLYSCTDSGWRKLHLEESLEIYYKALLPYLEKTDIRMTFDEFVADVHKYRNFGFVLSIFVLPLMLDPNPDPHAFRTWTGFKNWIKWRNETFSKPIKDDEHDMIKEINKRLIENIEEAYELGLMKC